MSITVRKTISPITENMQSFDMTLEITSASDMPMEVFVFKRGLPVLAPPPSAAPATPYPDIFISIADPVDLEEYPVGAPDMANSDPYFRLKIVTLRFRSLVELNRTWVYINEDLQGLVNSLKAASQPGTMEEITIS